MIHLLLILTPIALIDGISPVRIGALVTILSRKNWFVPAQVFLVGIYLCYYALGVGLALGADRLLDYLFPKNPTSLDFAVGGIVGVVLVGVGVRKLISGTLEPDGLNEPPEKLGRIFVSTIVITIATAPAAAPLLVAVDRTLRADLSIVGSYAALAFYCLIYVLPLIGLFALRSLLGPKAVSVLEQISHKISEAMPKAIAWLFVLLGVISLADALGYFLFARPLW